MNKTFFLKFNKKGSYWITHWCVYVCWKKKATYTNVTKEVETKKNR